MVKLTGIFNQINPTKVLVAGDLMLDTYTIGKARRISPEAPVAVLHVQREEHRPGGAGNVILNLISLGVDVVALGRVGPDHAGELLLQTLSAEGVLVEGIVTQACYQTPVKNRIIADNQQVVRVDHEQVSAIPEQLEQKVIESLPLLLDGVNVVAISDYDKGFLSRTLLTALIDLSKQRGIPVIADPKGIDFTKYQGTTVIKPNLGEAYAAANLPSNAPLEQVAARVLQMTQAETLMVTRSEAGISLFHREGSRHDFPVRVREIKDVTGAGDTVLATLTCVLANGLPMTAAAQLSNIAAGIAIEHFGCARVTLSELARRMIEDDIENKVFEEEHLFVLHEALRGRQYALLSICSSDGLTSLIFSTIRQLARKENRDLLVYVRESSPDAEFIDLLASLCEVDFIILKSESLQQLTQQITPEEIYSIEKGQCTPVISVSALY
jgi:D-beta-D-heptose 7-phosphate kinase/D-beta-D-heptose 1-phosphate adenosyltransferase